MGKYRNEIGAYGENVAEKYLRNKKYNIIDRNFNCRNGEIDIIAQEKDIYVFVEVKTRRDTSYGRPMEAINAYKLRNMVRTVEVYRKMKHLYDVPIRLDAIEVIINSEKKVKINHIENISFWSSWKTKTACKRHHI